MPEIEFTQYLLPDGRRKSIRIDRPDAVAARADALVDAGYRFEAEVLTTGQVSFTIVGKDEDGDEDDLDIRVVPNGPGVADAVDDLILNFKAAE